MLTAFKEKYATEAGYATEVWVAAGELLLQRDKMRMAIIYEKFCATEAGEIQYAHLEKFTTKCWKPENVVAVTTSLKRFGERKEGGKGWKGCEGFCRLVDQKSVGGKKNRGQEKQRYWLKLKEI